MVYHPSNPTLLCSCKLISPCIHVCMITGHKSIHALRFCKMRPSCSYKELKSAILILPSLHLVECHIEYKSIYAFYEDIIVNFSGYYTWDAPPSNVQSKTNCFSRERLALRTSSGSSIGSIRTHIYQTKKKRLSYY